jgi:hypothetical protein
VSLPVRVSGSCPEDAALLNWTGVVQATKLRIKKRRRTNAWDLWTISVRPFALHRILAPLTEEPTFSPP